MKVEFVTQLRVYKNNGKWVTLDPFVVRVDDYPYVIPTGFETDFASVPRVPFAYLIAGNLAHKSALLHDYLYQQQIGQELADNIFYYAMEEEGISAIKRNLMWGALRAFGGQAYRKYKKS